MLLQVVTCTAHSLGKTLKYLKTGDFSKTYLHSQQSYPQSLLTSYLQSVLALAYTLGRCRLVIFPPELYSHQNEMSIDQIHVT